ncbi:MAG: APC family permease, partial [Phenylobacterium sp.]
MSDAAPAETQLVRALRRRDLIGLLLNAMMGAGMLAAPSKVYATAGGWSFTVLLASALLLAPLILCFAELGSRFSATGGPYLYARTALPPAPAFAVGWLLWFSQAMSAATLSNLLVSYAGGFVPAIEAGPARLALIAVVGAGLTAVALSGIRQSAQASNLLIVVKVAFVGLFLLAGLPFVDFARLAVEGPPPPPPVFATAMLIYLFAYSGFERASVVAGEAKDPRRDVPLALTAAVIIATLAYGAVLLVCVGVLDAPAATDRPLAEAGRLLFGHPGAIAVSVGALAVILGTLLGIVIAMPRMLLALSEQDQLPAELAAVHPRWRTPHVAILISSVLAFGFAMGSDLLGSLTIATATRLVAYILCCIALVVFSRRPDAPPPKFRLPFAAPLAVVTGVLFTGVLLLGARKELLPLAAVTAIGLLLLSAHRWRQRSRA